MSPSAAPPSPQEIQRKLSVHSVAKSNKPPPVSVPPVSGTESDSDSILTPDPWTMSPVSGIVGPGGPTQQPLSSIAERRSGSGEDSEDDVDEGEGGWKTAEVNDKELRGSFDESVIKAGYLWKKGERRKTWKKRWFVLRPAHLAYYKTAAEYQLLRLLDLSDVHSCTQVSLKRHENAFGLVSPVRTFYLQAKTPKEVQEWVQAIEEARQAQSSPNTGSSPIPIPKTDRSTSHAPPLTPSPPSQIPYVTSSDSEDASPSGQQAHSPSSHPASSPSKVPTTASAVKDSSKTVLSGYLMKCGSKRRNWRKRWFVLTGEKLMYFASHMDTKPHRQFAFKDILDALEYDIPTHRQHGTPIASPPIPDSDNPHNSHTFKIVTTKKTLLLCAPSEEDEITWLGAVRALIARRSAGTAPTEGSKPNASGAPGSTDVSPNNSGFASGSGGIKAKVRRLSSSAASVTNAVIREDKREDKQP
ncbi:hypothetical protein VNI00_004962 [Paramarasmius palmivorus]|uniref:PH domain-containing protein n=1 Tax=Paramarasmius palmivorus TaxID=297713 RepID=A0AAW0DK08_9AGAR